MNKEILFKAKRTDNGEWAEGSLITGVFLRGGQDISYILCPDKADYDCFEDFSEENGIFEVDPETVCQYTGKEYMDSEAAYEGDIFESQVSGDLMILRYGTYQAYCPVDKVYMDSVGFYVECKGYPDMPIGDLHDYALKKGNIFDNSNLLEAAVGGDGMTESEAKAIKWMKSVRDGAVATLDHIAKKEKAEVILNAFEELEQYRALGTVEELRKAMEKQDAKRPDIWGNGYDNEGNMIYDMYDCPNCGESYEIDYEEYEFCPKCGQALALSGIQEGEKKCLK